MFYIVEKDNPNMKIEHFLWLDLIKSSREQHTVIECTIQEIPRVLENTPPIIIPLGCIDFTNEVLRHKYNISCMMPAEVPLCLRKEAFLGRFYKICPAADIPRDGAYFIKDATQMKGFSHLGSVKQIFHNDINPEHNYVVSSIVNIQSEYRVYIIGGEVYAIEYYNGNACVLPDIKKIQMMNLMYMMQPDYPISYTMDIMVTEEGTFLTEIHPTLFSCGLYTTLLSESFLKGYEDGLRYLQNHNTPAQIG